MYTRLSLSVKITVWLFLIFTSASAFAVEELIGEMPQESQVKGEVYMGSKYIYNTFYDFDRNKSDGLLVVQPRIEGGTTGSAFTAKAKANMLYEKFAGNAIQDHLDYAGQGEVKWDATASWTNELFADYKAFSDLSPDENYGRIPRTVVTGGTNNKFQMSQGVSFDVNLQYAMETFSNTKMIDNNYLNNSDANAVFQYNKAFLPETFWFLRVNGGSREFAKKEVNKQGKDTVQPKNNSFYVAGEGGVSGRLTEKSVIDFATGLLYRQYAKGDSFIGPVFYFKFTEQISRRQQLSAGYSYSIRDSYFTNYVLDQEVYIGFARMLGDQVLFMSRVGYNYRSFSLPVRREDQRLTGSVVVNYSLKPDLKIVGDFKLDLLSSDAYDNTVNDGSITNPLPVNPDRPASYKNASLGLGVVANF